MLKENTQKSLEIQELFSDLIKKYEMSIAIVDLKNPNAEVFGYNLDHFIYPASVYKIFIGAEVLRRIEMGDFALDQIIEVKAPNDVDKDARIFPGDTRKLLTAGEKVTIDYLLNLMLTRSDNTASNCLIDLVSRESITENIIYKNNWQGSEVTRKFLDRIKEEKSYQYSSTTLTCARHLAEFFYLVETENLISRFVSRKLKEYMLQFNRLGKQGAFLPGVYKEFYCKGGWLETNLYKYNPVSLFKAVLNKGWAIIRWSNDAGVVTTQNSHYVIIIMSVTKTLSPWHYFPIRKVAEEVLEYMETIR